MPKYYRPGEAGFWEMEPEFLRSVQDACKPFNLDILHFVLGDADSPHTPVAAVLRMPPGFELPRHAHSVTRFEVVVQGSITVDGRELLPGDIMVSPPNEMYGPHVAGADGATTIEFFSSIQGVGNVIHDTPDGPRAESYRS